MSPRGQRRDREKEKGGDQGTQGEVGERWRGHPKLGTMAMVDDQSWIDVDSRSDE
jgi:hypothetical protein